MKRTRTKQETVTLPKPTGGTYVFVPDEDLTPEQVKQIYEDDREQCMHEIGTMLELQPRGDRVAAGFRAIEELHDYFPGDQEVPKEGAWILVKTPPPTEYTVPAMSIWFATPWPHKNERRNSHRCRIVTPRGDLGIYPREYVLIREPQKYYEFLGDGMEMKFFGNQNENGIPADKLFYLRSRGISKLDAIKLLIGEIKAHGLCWIESSEEVQRTFCRELPPKERLATYIVEEVMT